MSDDLVKQLRNSKGWPTLGNAAADRIEELNETLSKALKALDFAETATATGDGLTVSETLSLHLRISAIIAELKDKTNE